MGFELAIGARLRKTPFHAATVAAGATAFTVYNHMLLPVSYGDPVAEYWRLIRGVSLWDVACERQVEIAGPDALALVCYLSTRDLSRCRVGQGKYAPLCDHDGRLINDPVLLRLAEDVFWLSLADSDVLLWARAIAAERGLDVAVSEPDVSPLAVQGPKAEAVMTDLFGEWPSKLRYFWFREAELDSIPLVVARSGWSKQGGFELYLRDGARGSDLWARVMQAGQAHGITPGSPNPIERVESGLLSYGGDTVSHANPFEVRLERFVDLDRPDDFIGKAALQEIARSGPRRRQVGLFLDGGRMGSTEHALPVMSGGRRVGWATATAHSPRLERNIAIALVDVDALDAGGGLTVETDDRSRGATPTELPFC